MANIFDPKTNTYTVTPSGSQEDASYQLGTTYDDAATSDVVEELPADVAYSKQIQENRANLGLPANESSAWELYKNGQHQSQTSARYLDGLKAAKVIEEVVEQPVEKVIKQPSATTGVQQALPEGTVAAGQPVVATVNSLGQVIPQNITQAVTPPVYNDTGFATTNIGDAKSGTLGKPLQTAGLSAVPLTASYKTHYAGTPGLVDQTLLAPTGGPGSGSQQVRYYNPTTKQELMVTVFNGVAVTYVPPGFVRKPIE